MRSKFAMPGRLPRLLSVFDSRGSFHRLGLRERLFLSQLPLNLCTLAAAGILAFTSPGVLRDPMFLASALIIVLVTVATLAVPWERLPKAAYLTLPLLDLVAVGLLHSANAGGPVALAALSVFPVFWLAWSGMAPCTPGPSVSWAR